MDRPEPGLVKWSPNPDHESFIHINLQHRVVQLYKPTGHARHGRFDYERLSKHDDFPPLTTFDWSPTTPGLLAVGTGTGIVNLLRIDDNSNAYIELGLKMTRTCQAVAFNTQGLLAVGLDRVRMDQCLHIWDVNRLSSLPQNFSGFPQDFSPFAESVTRLEPSVSVSSIRFFEDSPQTLVVGIKAQGLRIHDLRDPSSVVNFQTRCNNNLCIDYADQNYFTSSALDHPGVMIWDRRATARPVASRSYLDAIEEDDLPWGSALQLNQVIEMEAQPSMSDSKHSFIRSLRYCRDQRGLLAVLTRTGQLKVLKTNKELATQDPEFANSPELLSVYKSHDMDVLNSSSTRKSDRIVSCDWITTGSPVLRPRLLVLRANGSFGILEQPSYTSDYVYKLTPWQAPHRGLQDGGPYMDLMRFEPSQAPDILGPLLVDQALSDVPIFGENRVDLASVVEEATNSQVSESGLVGDLDASEDALPESFTNASTTAEKLRALRAYIKDRTKSASKTPVEGLADAAAELSLSATGPPTNRELHDELLTTLLEAKGLPSKARAVLDHIMLLRAKEKYLFNTTINRAVVDDDPWIRYLWLWISDAEAATEEGGMIASPIDLSYLGVATVWMNDLGRKPSLRLLDGASPLDDSVWESCIESICQRRRIPEFEGVTTNKPFHRQLCLDICAWGMYEEDENDNLLEPAPEYPTTVHTMATAKALFRGNTKQAIRILKKASGKHPELLFVSLALQLVGKGDRELAKEHLDFDEAVASKTDPYLRAISSLIATGDWAAIANQKSLPLPDRAYVAVRNLPDDRLTDWLKEQVDIAVDGGDVEAIVLTGITERLVDVFAKFIEKFNDFQTATLVMSICAPRYIDDYRCLAWRNAYRAYLQRHKAFLERTKFEVESTKRSKRGGRPTVKPPSRQIALRCVYCDAETSLARLDGGAPQVEQQHQQRNPLMATSVNAGVSCPSCGRHLPRCVVCLEVVGVPRSDRPEANPDPEVRLAARFPTFCLRCEHVLHLDHARQWFARHAECPVPECRCRCNFRANPELNYR
ncbi:hypothetical protein jhhlp_006885 [Lomentospora prolificans]|uniref:Uncharacterized protein n=1 Tax=Lomentospora prolificans TaxID=41688 RepID=A0A2N3N306_9PEZI|nr:hypothetical protein jhhlp_006885 [Lomentospora prolificans]